MAKKRATRQVTRPRAKRAKWTVLVYMAAKMTEDLDTHAVRDLREMERAQLADGVRVLVQINRHWPTRPQRYQISPSGSQLLEADIPDLDTGSGQTLSNFLTFAATYYPSDRYFLVLWGHSYGLGFGRDHDDALTLPELRRALEDFKRVREGSSLELLGANACAMSYAEAAYELRNVATCMVASQIAVPYAGWPYESILGRITGTSSALEIGQLVVDRYVTSFGSVSATRQVAMTVLTLTLGDAFRRRFQALARALADVVSGPDAGSGDRLSHVRAVFRSTAAGDVRPLLDLHDLCLRLDALCEDLLTLQPQASAEVTPLRVAASAMAGLLDQGPMFVDGYTTARAVGEAFVAYHKAHPELYDLRGVGIYAPFVTELTDLIRLGLDEDDAQTGRKRYASLGLVRGTGWERLVYETLRAGLPSDMVRNIEASGAVSLADRGDVSQMLTSVDSMFDVLDRRIAATRIKAMAALRAPSTLPVQPRPSPSKAQSANARPQPHGLQLVRHDVLEQALSAQLSPSAPGPLQQAAAAAAAAAVGAAAQIAMSAASGAAGGGASQTAPAAVAAAQAASAASTAAAATTRAAVAAAAALVKPTFEGLEDMVAEVERSVRRTLTNGAFGLGPGPSANGLTPLAHGSLAKPADGHGGPIKPADAHGGPVKPADAHGPSANGAASPFVTAGLNGGATSPNAIVSSLFAQVGETLAQLESAIADAETIAALATLPAGTGPAGPPPATRMDRAFRVLADASTDARRTLRRVLAHPLYGFGPGAQTMEMEDRRELARIGGMSSRGLTLL